MAAKSLSVTVPPDEVAEWESRRLLRSEFGGCRLWDGRLSPVR